MTRSVGVYVCPRGAFGIECRMSRAGLRVERTFEYPRALATGCDAAQHVAQSLASLGIGRTNVCVAVRGFGAAYHVMTLPRAADHLLTPIIERELRRLEPELKDAAISWKPLPVEARGADEAHAPRQVAVAAAPVAVVSDFGSALRTNGNSLRHFTVLGAAIEQVEQEFLPSLEAVAAASPLPDGLFIGFCLDGALRLAVEPPPGDAYSPDDAAALAEELELGVMFMRQQYRGAQVSRIAMLASADRLGDAESVIRDRLSVPVERVPVADLDAAGCAALGALLDAGSAHPLALGGQLRGRQESGAEHALHSASVFAVIIAIVVGAWSIVAAVRARDTAIALQAAQARIEQESFGLMSARETAAQRKLINDARTALHEVDFDRVALQRTLARIAAAAATPVQLDSLVLDRTAGGWSARLTGRTGGVSNARAVQALSEFYSEIPRQLAVSGLSLERLAYGDSASAAAQVRFTIAFAVRGASGGVR